MPLVKYFPQRKKISVCKETPNYPDGGLAV